MSSAIESKAKFSSNPSSLPVRQRRPDKSHTEMQEAPALTMDRFGFILDCNNSVEKLFGYRSGDLVFQNVSKLLPQLSGAPLIQEEQINPTIRLLCDCGYLFRAQNRQGDTFPTELSFVQLEHDGIYTLRLTVRPSGKFE